MKTILLDIIGIMLMRTWIMGTREITAPHSGGEYYSDNLIVSHFHIILREAPVLGIYLYHCLEYRTLQELIEESYFFLFNDVLWQLSKLQASLS